MRKVFFGHGPQIPLREGLRELSHVRSDFETLLILGLPLRDRVSGLLLLQAPQKGLVLKGDSGRVVSALVLVEWVDLDSLGVVEFGLCVAHYARHLLKQDPILAFNLPVFAF